MFSNLHFLLRCPRDLYIKIIYKCSSVVVTARSLTSGNASRRFRAPSDDRATEIAAYQPDVVVERSFLILPSANNRPASGIIYRDLVQLTRSRLSARSGLNVRI